MARALDMAGYWLKVLRSCGCATMFGGCVVWVPCRHVRTALPCAQGTRHTTQWHPSQLVCTPRHPRTKSMHACMHAAPGHAHASKHNPVAVDSAIHAHSATTLIKSCVVQYCSTPALPWCSTSFQNYCMSPHFKALAKRPAGPTEARSLCKTACLHACDVLVTARDEDTHVDTRPRSSMRARRCSRPAGQS